jgi:methyl-accepting chemotaxis protein
MGDSLREIVGHAIEITRRVDDGSRDLALGAKESSQAADDVANSIGTMAAGAESQSDVTEQVVASVDRITSDIMSTTKAVGEVINASSVAKERASLGADRIDEAGQRMTEITRVIEDAVSVIDEVGQHSERVEQIVDIVR